MLYELVAFSDQFGPLNVFRYITFRTMGALVTVPLPRLNTPLSLKAPMAWLRNSARKLRVFRTANWLFVSGASVLMCLGASHAGSCGPQLCQT